MKFGVFMFPTDFTMDIIELGKAAEAHGLESLFVPEHTHIPASRRTPYPAGGELPPEYSHALDPFVGLAAVAAVTTRLKLGTGISLVIEHNPISLAKQVASLDYLSGGRVLFGVGGGWNLEEMENHGTNPRQRWKVLRERVLAMKQIWTQDEAGYQGEFVRFDPVWAWPKPVQKPHPPVIIGGNGPHTLRRVVEYGDEWMPIARLGREPFTDRIAELRRLGEAAGRGPIPVSAFGVPADPREIEEYQAAGVERCIGWLPPAGRDKVLPRLEAFAELARRFA